MRKSEYKKAFNISEKELQKKALNGDIRIVTKGRTEYIEFLK